MVHSYVRYRCSRVWCIEVYHWVSAGGFPGRCCAVHGRARLASGARRHGVHGCPRYGIGDAFSSLSYGSSAPGSSREAGWPSTPRAVLRARRGPPSDVVSKSIHRGGDVILTHLTEIVRRTGNDRFLHRYRSPGDGPGPRPRLHALPEVLARTWERLAPAMDGSGSSFETYFELHELDVSGVSGIAGCSVQCRRTLHAVPTAGLLMQSPEAVLASPRIEFDPEHIRLWADCIIHEAVGQAHLVRATSAVSGGRTRMRLLHRPDSAAPFPVLRCCSRG